MGQAVDAGGIGWAAYRGIRSTARRLGLGRLRDRMKDRLYASPRWTAVPPHRLKDLDPNGILPPPKVALTFDDGPDPEVTPRLLDVLASHGVQATFFMCGAAAERYPDLVRSVAAAGHSIGGHSWDHPRQGVRGLTEQEWRRQIDDTHTLLEELTGEHIRWFRPPRGMTERRAWNALRRQGLTTVLWSVDGWDCKLRDPDQIAAGVLAGLGPSGIVLLHDANANFMFASPRPLYGELGNQESTIWAVELILDGAHEQGLEPVSLDMVPTRLMPARGGLRLAG